MTNQQQSTVVDYNKKRVDIQFSELHFDKIPLKVCRRFMEQYHYSGGLGNAAMSWGAYHNPTGELVAAIAFQTPISENTRASVFENAPYNFETCFEETIVHPSNRCRCAFIDVWHGYREHITELHRLAVVPRAPKNMGSWLISKALTALKQYKPKYWAVISMADSTEGHDGTQYQGANADYYGTTEARVEYIDEEGQLRSPRQCGENITLEKAEERGWEVVKREEKHRYVFWLPYRSGQSIDGLREFSEIELQDYPE